MTDEITERNTEYTNFCHFLSSEVQLNCLSIARAVDLHVDVL